MSSNPTYQESFFLERAPFSQSAAAVVVPILHKIFSADSVVDIGCGSGSWLAVFKSLGVKRILGIDGDYVPRSQLEISELEFKAQDLSTPLQFNERFQLALCLEVAEHLPRSAADTLLDSLASASDVIAFSAAIPRQAGTGHVNLRWQSEWALEFRKRNYIALDLVRPHVWQDKRVPFWYCQNLLIYVRCGSPALQALNSMQNCMPTLLDVVHPRCFEQYLDHYRGFTSLLKELPFSFGRMLKHRFRSNRPPSDRRGEKTG